MTERKRRTFTSRFKADAVRLVTTGGKTLAPVSKQVDLTDTALRAWVKRVEADACMGPPDAPTSRKRAKLLELRKRVKRPEMERDILKKATTFFERESV